MTPPSRLLVGETEDLHASPGSPLFPLAHVARDRPSDRHRGHRPRPVLRPEQGAVPHLQARDHEDGALRHLLLPGGARGGGACRANGGALARAAHQTHAPRAERPAGAHPRGRCAAEILFSRLRARGVRPPALRFLDFPRRSPRECPDFVPPAPSPGLLRRSRGARPASGGAISIRSPGEK